MDLVQVGDGLITLAIGKTAYEQIYLATAPSDDGGPEEPYLKDPEGFVSALLKAGGFVIVEKGPAGKIYAKGGVPETTEPQFFPYTGMASWLEGWPTQELQRLPSESGLTINETGLALVRPFEVRSVRWDEADQMVAAANRGDASVEVYRLSSASGVSVNYPADLYLAPSDIRELGGTVRALSHDSTYNAAQGSKFYPLFTTCPEYVDERQTLESEAAASQPAPGQNDDLWPNEPTEAGLYVLSTGILKVENYTVTRVPFASMTQLFGESDGGFQFFPSEVAIEPISMEEGAAYRQFRQEVLRAGNLVGSGDSATFIRIDDAAGPPPAAAHFYALVEQYVTLDQNGVPHPRPTAEMPAEKTRLEWRLEGQ